MNQRFKYAIPPHALSFPATADRICGAEPRPHTYGVRHLPCAPLATEPCRPTACNPSIPPHTLSFLAAASQICVAEPPTISMSFPATVDHFCLAEPPRPTANYSLLAANSPTYTFSAKEKDPETGLSYFGSRYYSSDLSVWLSVDPMADKYPSMSPYVYCANNPVRCVDPNGEEIDVSVIYQKNDDGSYKYKSVVKAFDFFAKTKIGQNFLSKYAKKGQTIAEHTYESDGYYHQKGIDISFISNDDKLLASGASGTTESNIKDGRMKTKINLSNTCESTGGAGNVLEVLCHELFIHAYQDAQDYLDDKKLNNSQLNLYCKKLIGSYSLSSIQHRQDASFNNMMSNYAMPILRAYYNGSSIYRKKLPDSEIKQRINNGLGGATIK